MELMDHRVGENGLLPFRTQRVFSVGSEWYFAIRGGEDCGPFQNMQDAETELNLFLSEFKSNYYNSKLKVY